MDLARRTPPIPFVHVVDWRGPKSFVWNAIKNDAVHSSLSSTAFWFLRHPATTFQNCHRVHPPKCSMALSDLTLPLLTHPLQRVLLHSHNLTNPHPAHIKNTVPSTATTTLKKVLVLTLHPSSFPLNSHLSSFSEQMSGL